MMSNRFLPSPFRPNRLEADNRERRHRPVRTGDLRRGNTIRKVPKRQFARKPAVPACMDKHICRQANTAREGALQ